MEKVKAHRRDIQFFSRKNDMLYVVHTDIVERYAKYLEGDQSVKAYSPCVPLSTEKVSEVNPLDIRAEYLAKSMWETDFLIEHMNGTQAVREVACVDDFKKRAVVEQLELSRRYWAAQGIDDWKIVIFRKSGREKEGADYVL